MRTYYEFEHRPGYGRDDHMADEIIARAIGHLGADTSEYVAAALGLRSHAVPMGSVRVQIPAAAGVRRRMQRALRRALRQVRSRDTWIYVACYRERRREGGALLEERRGHRWVCVD